MKAQAALIGADCAVEFNAVTAVDMNASLVIFPWNPEHDLPLGLNQAFQYAIVTKLGVRLQCRNQSVQDLLHRLQKFCLAGIPSFYGPNHLLYILLHCCPFTMVTLPG